MLQRMRAEAREIKRNIHAVALASVDPRVPWYAKALAAAVAAYAFSPIDLIPDFIPIIGYLDDLILLPIGIRTVIRLIPTDVWAELRQRAEDSAERRGGKGAAVVIVALWLGLAIWAGVLIRRQMQ